MVCSPRDVVREVLSSIPGGTASFSFLFFCLLFVLCFLVIVVLFGFFIWRRFFTFINFLPFWLISLSSYFLPFPRSATRGPAIHVFLVTLSHLFVNASINIKL